METTYNKIRYTDSSYQEDSNSCTVVALSVAGNYSFEEAQSFLAFHGRQLNRGYHYYRAYKEVLSMTAVELGDDYRKITYTQALDKYNLLLEGTWLVTTTTHISCIKDGRIEDWMKYGDQDRVCSIYRVNSAKKLPPHQVELGSEKVAKKKIELTKPAKRYTNTWKDCSYWGEKGVYQYIVTVTTWDKRKKRRTIWKDYSHTIEETPRSWEYGLGTNYQVEKADYKLNPHYIEDED